MMGIPILLKGTVALVGAGPGDPGLLTVKGYHYIQQADALVYDHLVAEELLAEAPVEAERIYAGKVAGKHIKSQDEINWLLVELARQNKRVVRLKGGDPFIFGRGAEECMVLRQHGIPFEIVPGVSAVAAVPAYAGIPITARDISPAFLAVTGHEHACKEKPDVDWASIAQVKTTLVIFMGVLSLGSITQELIRHGRSPQTPVAVIRWGTVPGRQQTLVASLATIADRVAEEAFRPPALIVIGDVVKYREHLHWFESLEYDGRQSNTRT